MRDNEGLTRAVATSDMGMEPDHVKDADRVAAMGLGARGELGSLVFRFARAELPQWGRRIVLILARRIAHRHRIGRQLAEKVAACALLEFARPHCRACGGAGETLLDEVRVTCSRCGGSRVERYGNAERAAVIGAYGKRIDDVMRGCNDGSSVARKFVCARVDLRKRLPICRLPYH